MQLHSHHKRIRDFTGHTCSLHPDELSRHATEIALARARRRLGGRPPDLARRALALAGPEARKDETLFSIARAIAWETGADQDEILCRLGEKYPDLS